MSFTEALRPSTPCHSQLTIQWQSNDPRVESFQLIHAEKSGLQVRIFVDHWANNCCHSLIVTQAANNQKLCSSNESQCLTAADYAASCSCETYTGLSLALQSMVNIPSEGNCEVSTGRCSFNLTSSVVLSTNSTYVFGLRGMLRYIDPDTSKSKTAFSSYFFASHVFENDVARLTVSNTSIVFKEGTNSSFFISLPCQPIADVAIEVDVVTIGNVSRVHVIPSSLVVGPSNWSMHHTISMFAVDDHQGGNYITNYTVTHSLYSTDSVFNAQQIGGISIGIEEADGGIKECMPNNPFSIAGFLVEGSNSTSWLSLSSQPAAEVLVNITSQSEDVQIDPGYLRFTRNNWQQCQNFTVNAIHDNVGETYAERHSIVYQTTSSDNRFHAVQKVFEFAVIDVDFKVMASWSNMSITEGSSVSYYISLVGQPKENVTIIISTSGTTTQLHTNVTALYFSTSNWNQKQFVLINTFADGVGGMYETQFEIAHHILGTVSSEPLATLQPLVLTVLDQDWGVQFTTHEVALFEGSGVTYGIKLSSQPSSEVQVNISSDLGVVGVNAYPGVFIFGQGNWNSFQIFTARAIRGHTREIPVSHSQLVHKFESMDQRYADISQVVTVNVTSMHVGVMSTPQNQTVGEGGQFSYELALASEPLSLVTVMLHVESAYFTVSPSTVTFQPSSWRVDHNITVISNSDTIGPTAVEMHPVWYTAVSEDSRYNRLPIPNTTLTVVNADVGIQLAISLINMREGSTARYTVQLQTQPMANTTIDITRSTTDVTLVPSQVFFTSENWFLPQVIEITAVFDNTGELYTKASTITHRCFGQDVRYFGLSRNVTVLVTDVDVSIARSSQTAEVTEGDHSVSYNLSLGSQPSAPVIITLTTTHSGLVVSPSVVAFSTTNWSAVQLVTLHSDADDIVEPFKQFVYVEHRAHSVDLRYHDLISNMTVSLLESLFGAIIQSAPTVLNEGESRQYALVLNRPPNQNVEVMIHGFPGHVETNPASVIFTATNWNQPQNVTLSALKNNAPQLLNATFVVRHICRSDDARFNTVPTAMHLNVIDGDSAIRLSRDEVVVYAGKAVQYMVSISTQPMHDVTVAIFAPGSGLIVTPPTVVFQQSDWARLQNVSIFAAPGSVTETSLVQHSVSSVDGRYNLPTKVITARLLGADAAMTLSNIALEVGTVGNVTYSFRLAAEPLAFMTINVAAPRDGQYLQVSPSSFIVDRGNWGDRHYITVSAANGQIVDGIKQVLLDHNISSSDPRYNRMHQRLAVDVIQAGSSVTVEVKVSAVATFRIFIREFKSEPFRQSMANISGVPTSSVVLGTLEVVQLSRRLVATGVRVPYTVTTSSSVAAQNIMAIYSAPSFSAALATKLSAAGMTVNATAVQSISNLGSQKTVVTPAPTPFVAATDAPTLEPTLSAPVAESDTFLGEIMGGIFAALLVFGVVFWRTTRTRRSDIQRARDLFPEKGSAEQRQTAAHKTVDFAEQIGHIKAQKQAQIDMNPQAGLDNAAMSVVEQPGLDSQHTVGTAPVAEQPSGAAHPHTPVSEHAHWETCRDPSSGHHYFYNRVSKISSWYHPHSAQAAIPNPLNSPPEGGDEWEERHDPTSGHTFYYNRRTSESSWHKVQNGLGASLAQQLDEARWGEPPRGGSAVKVDVASETRPASAASPMQTMSRMAAAPAATQIAKKHDVLYV
jgi:hypothetical protein